MVVRSLLIECNPFGGCKLFLSCCRTKEAEFKKAIGDMGMQLTQAKIEANLREMNILAAAQAREEQLRREMDDLRAMLQSQKDSQATTN